MSDALRAAADAAYRAVRQPVEGTMLTVIREMAEAAADTPDAISLPALLTAVTRPAPRRSNTPPTSSRRCGGRASSTPAATACWSSAARRGGRLSQRRDRQRGRGGGHRRRQRPPPRPRLAPHRRHPCRRHEESRFRYCTSFLLLGDDLDHDDLEQFVNTLGDSALVVGGERMLKVHVHTDDPGAVLSYASAHGTIDEVEINDMREQTRARDERLRRDQRVGVRGRRRRRGQQDALSRAGLRAVIDGGQSMNPSAAQLLAAVESLDADEVVVLPNNGNVVLTAEQAAA